MLEFKRLFHSGSPNEGVQKGAKCFPRVSTTYLLSLVAAVALVGAGTFLAALQVDGLNCLHHRIDKAAACECASLQGCSAAGGMLGMKHILPTGLSANTVTMTMLTIQAGNNMLGIVCVDLAAGTNDYGRLLCSQRPLLFSLLQQLLNSDPALSRVLIPTAPDILRTFAHCLCNPRRLSQHRFLL